MKLHGCLWACLSLAAALPVASQTVETFSFTGLSRAVPDGSASGLSDFQTINSSISAISTLRVRLQITGEFNGDLYAYLRHIQGGATNFCVLLNRAGRTAVSPWGYDDAGFDITFDDDAANGNVHVYRNVLTPPAGSPLTGSWRPDGRLVDPDLVLDTSPVTATLNSFDGRNPDGEWTLFVADLESGGTNMLVSWELEITGGAVPSVTWPTPANIVYGTVLGTAQLNASSPVSGNFTYDPPAGTVLNAGAGQTLSVTFTPTDTIAYSPVTTSLPITVLTKALTITADNKNKVYGASLPALTTTYSGFVNGDTPASLDSPAVLSTTATSGSNTGGYPIAVNGAADANYSITFVSGTLTVTPAPLTITADSKSKIYGAVAPALTASYAGFVNGDTAPSLDTQVSLTTTASAGSNVGGYTITATGAADPNYTITFVPGTFTITSAALTITADNKNKVYGAVVPALTASYAGFVNGDTVGSLDTPVSLSTTAAATSNAGSYPITAGGATDANYTIAFVSGTLTVTPAALTVTADNKSKVYGAALPALTATYSGFVNGDAAGSLDTPVSLATTATAASGVGLYTIAAAGAADANYAITFAPGTLTITAGSVTTSLISSVNPATPGQLVTFTFTASPVAPGAGTPGGSVQFKIDGVNSGAPVPLLAGAASYSISTLAAGTHTVAAEYPGEVNFTGGNITLNPNQLINTPPTAQNDTVQRTLPNGAKVLLSSLLGNDSDADGDAFSLVSISSTSLNGGTVTLSGGWVLYLPPAGFSNNDSFTYTIADAYNSQSIGTVLIQIAGGESQAENLHITPLGGSFNLRFDGIPGRTYRIEYSGSLSTPSWILLESVTADPVGNFEHTDTPPPEVLQRYYRAVYP